MRRNKVAINRVEEEIVNFQESQVEIKILKNKKELNHNQQLRLNELQRITEAMESTFNLLGKEQMQLITLRYWSNNLLTWDGVASNLNIGRITAFRWKDEIIKEITNRLGW